MSHNAERLAALSLAAATLIGAAALGWALSGQVEARALARMERLLLAAGHGWAAVAGDGLTAVLTGAAPDAAARADAAAIVGASLPGLQLVVEVSLAPPPPPPAPPKGFALDILSDETGITLGGTAPGAAARHDLVAALAAAGSGLAPVDFAEDIDVPLPEDWRVIEAATVAAAGALLHGRVALSPGSVAITGLPRDEAARQLIARHAAALSQTGVSVTVDLVAPAVDQEAPYVFMAEREGEGARVRACTVPSAQAASLVRAKAAAMLGAYGVRCEIVAPPPDTAWVQAVEAGLAALAGTPGGRFVLEGLEARLIPAPDAMGTSFDSAVGTLRAALPERFALIAAPSDSAASDPVAAPSVWFRARLVDGRLTLSGIAPDAVTRTTMLSYAAAAFGSDDLRDDLTVAETVAVDGWRTAVLAAIDALRPLDRGEAVVIDGRLRLWGATPEPVALRQTETALDAVRAAGWMATSRVTVDLPARLAMQRLGPEACLAALSAIVEADPILFEPASATIDAASLPTLDALGAMLDRCQPALIEIGGHTDAQGPVDLNETLSAARAEAVRTALVMRGVAPGLLDTHGYGPARPVADNATEAGRALNRRITFSPPRVSLVPAASLIDPTLTADDVGAPLSRGEPPPAVVPTPRPERTP